MLTCPARIRSLAKMKVVPAKDEMRRLQIFMCHAVEDKPIVRLLFQGLKAIGVDPWLDEEELIGGDPWRSKTVRAVGDSDAVVILLSSTSVKKHGFVQKEIREAIGQRDFHPDDALFVIPVRLEPCEIPDALSRWQCVDLYGSRGWELLVKSLEARIDQLPAVSPLQNSLPGFENAIHPERLADLGFEERFVELAKLFTDSYVGDYESLSRHIRDYLASNDSDWFSLYWLADDLLENQRAHSEVIQLIQELLPAMEGRPLWQGRFHKVAGLASLRKWFEDGRSDRDLLSSAKAHLLRSVEQNPAISEAHMHLAIVNAIEGSPTEVDNSLRHAIETLTDPKMRIATADIRDRLRKEPAAVLSMLRRFYSEGEPGT